MSDLNPTTPVPSLHAAFARLAPVFAALLLATVLSTAPAWAEPQSVNVNTADAEAIAEVLKGVGMSRAQAIVDYREQHGAFADAYDLVNVKGIGDSTVERNEARIRLKD